MIVVVGSCVLDMIFTAPELPRLGQTVLADSLETFPGGKGLNQAFAAARAGADVAMIGSVGRDDTGKMLIGALRAEGIATDHIVESDASTGVGVPIVVPDGDNGIVFHGGANTQLTVTDIQAAHSTIAAADVLLLQLELPIATAVEAARLAATAGTTVILNAAPAADVPTDLLAATNVLVLNQIEADTLSGQEEANAADIIRDTHGPDVALVTMGPDGVDWATATALGSVPAWPVDAIDTVGAGDTFVGALAAGLEAKLVLTDSIRFASAAAAICVTRRGAATATPTRVEIDEFLAERHSTLRRVPR